MSDGYCVAPVAAPVVAELRRLAWVSGGNCRSGVGLGTHSFQRSEDQELFWGVEWLAAGIQATVSTIARPIVEGLGLELVDVEYVREAGHRYLRLYIDREGGVTLTDCEAASRAVEARLDELDPIPEQYIFEVSSPGIERPLKQDADFIRFAGHMIRVTTYSPIAGRRTFIGELLGFADQQVRLRLAQPLQPGSAASELAIPKDQVAKAHLHVEV